MCRVLSYFFIVLFSTGEVLLPKFAFGQIDSSTVGIANRMLLFQRNNGGWPQPDGNPIKYDKVLSKKQAAQIKKDKKKLDTTIDDKATTREIIFLIEAYEETGNIKYLKAANKGVKYLLNAQTETGGWSQFFPDTTGYRKHITFNDNAMVNVLLVLKNVAEEKDGFAAIDKSLVSKAQTAVEKGISCILKCQYLQNGVPTVWCAQYDRKLLTPAKARAFELPGLNSSESVGIVRFLMKIKEPKAEVVSAINHAVKWLEKMEIKDKDVEIVRNSEGKPIDRVLVEKPGSIIWARFYDLESNRPFFAGRDSQKKWSLSEIEQERRLGYSFYGHYAENLLNKEYPKWKKKWNI